MNNQAPKYRVVRNTHDPHNPFTVEIKEPGKKNWRIVMHYATRQEAARIAAKYRDSWRNVAA